MQIAVHGRAFNENLKPHIQSLFDELKSRNAGIQLSAAYAKILQDAGIQYFTEVVFESKASLKACDFVLSLGGDGTLLEALTYIGEKEVPILGINTGRLGFLATISPNTLISELALLFQGKYDLENRTLVNVTSDNTLFEGINFGLNELGIMKTDSSSMIVINSYINNQFLNSYWADGLIVSTPTGSTGYNLSVGGPVVMPGSDIFVVSPMSPHNLNVRPMVVPDNVQLSFTVESRSGNFLVSLDSRYKVVDGSTKITLQKEQFVAKLVKLHGNDFLDTLRSKLNWGLDNRN
jgi:NAD+ kinase